MRSEANWKKQLDFAYAQISYWQDMANFYKEEAHYYKDIVVEAAEKGAILLVDEDGNDLISFDDDDFDDEEMI